MSFHLDLYNDAMAAYLQGRYQEAALVWQQAAAAALGLGLRAAWFRYMVWAAEATLHQGAPLASLGLLLTAREQEPSDAPQFDAWSARTMQFAIVRQTRPVLSRLAALLDELRTWHASHTVAAADPDFLQGELFLARGLWQTALASFEAGWAKHDGAGYVKYAYAAGAVALALKLQRPAVARDWLRALQACNENHADKDCEHARWQLALARLEGAHFTRLAPLLRTVTDHALAMQDNEWLDSARAATARVHLQDGAAGDPAGRYHPSRAALRQRPASRQDVHEVYANRLLLLDYRLACVRFAAGIAPVDDEYYAFAQQAAARATGEQVARIRQRLKKARAAAGWALAYAKYLDGLLECDWRQQEVAVRCERLDAIEVEALGDG